MDQSLPEIESNSTRSSLELLYNISRELSSALDLRTLLERVLLSSMQNVGAINGSIIVLDDHGESFAPALRLAGQPLYPPRVFVPAMKGHDILHFLIFH